MTGTTSSPHLPPLQLFSVQVAHCAGMISCQHRRPDMPGVGSGRMTRSMHVFRLTGAIARTGGTQQVVIASLDLLSGCPVGPLYSRVGRRGFQW